MSSPASPSQSGTRFTQGFDSMGEVFFTDSLVIRRVFDGYELEFSETVQFLEKNSLLEKYFVRTDPESGDANSSTHQGEIAAAKNYHHPRLQFITYAHEWATNAFREAALFQIELAKSLLAHGYFLKDFGITLNVLFDNSTPRWVDLFSVRKIENLNDEDYLKLDPNASLCEIIHKITEMHYVPYTLLPLYLGLAFGQKSARTITRETVLNTTNLQLGESILENAPDALKKYYFFYKEQKQNALKNNDPFQYLEIIRAEINGFPEFASSSAYSEYYKEKAQDFSITDRSEWGPKQIVVHDALSLHTPKTVLDIGSNTGWFSKLAAWHGATVLAIDTDEASINRLYSDARVNKLSIQPCVIDILNPTRDIYPAPHHRQGQGDSAASPVVLDLNSRGTADLVLALALTHHLTLGYGKSIEEVCKLLASFTRTTLVLEFVDKSDPVVVNEPSFFPAYSANPSEFVHYSEDVWVEALRFYFNDIVIKQSEGIRKLFICSGRKDSDDQDSSTNKQSLPATASTNSKVHRALKPVNLSVKPSQFEPSTEIPLRTPTVFAIGINNVCNLRCPLCVTGLREQTKVKQNIDFDFFKKIINKIAPYAQLVQLYKWGESLLHPNIVEMIELCTKLGLKTEISSNLSFRKDEVLEGIVSAKLGTLIVSLDGVSQEDYERYRVGGKFAWIIKNIKLLAQEKKRQNSQFPKIVLQYLRNKYTTNQVQILEDSYKDWGADELVVYDMTMPFKSRDHSKALEWFSEQEIAHRKFLDIDQSFHGKPCAFLDHYMVIEQDGSIPSCCYATDPTDDFGVWSDEKSIPEMFTSKRRAEAISMFNSKIPSPTNTCASCSIFQTWVNPNLISPPFKDKKFFSVIIPTYNRVKSLQETVKSFLAQDYPKHRFEIIIADNNSSPDTAAVGLYFQETYPESVKYIFVEKQGVHYARNKAACMARGEILYFTDDDILADPNLLNEISTGFDADSGVAVVTGRILPFWKSEPPAWVLKYLNNLWLSLNDLGTETKVTSSDPGAFSCHLAIKRSVFFKTNGFHPENTAGNWIGDGETGLNNVVRSFGHKFAYVGTAVVQHVIPPERMTQDYINKRLENQAACDAYSEYREKLFSNEDLLKRQLEWLRLSNEKYIEYVNALLSSDDSSYMKLAQHFYFLAKAKFELRLILDRDWRELVLRNDWLQSAMAEFSAELKTKVA